MSKVDWNVDPCTISQDAAASSLVWPNPEETKMLHEFFAVTFTSVYRVTDAYQEDGLTPIVEKIALRGGSEISVGEKLVRSTLPRHHVVYLSSEGITIFDASANASGCMEAATTRHQGGRTSPIVGLFLDQNEAMKCFALGSRINLDPRWQPQTEAVMTKIGSEHPVFRFSSHPEYEITY